MTLRRVLIAWELGGHLGHLARLLPIARELRGRGVAVLWVVRDVPQAVAVLGVADWELMQAPLPMQRPPRAYGASCHADVLLLDGFGQADQVKARVAVWHSIFRLFKPDAVLADFSPMAIYAAQTVGLPVAAIGHGFEIPPINAPELPSFQPWNSTWRARQQVAQAELNKAFSQLNPDAPLSLQAMYPINRCAVCIHPELDHFERPQAYFTGPLWSDLAGGVAPTWPMGIGLKILCYLRPQGINLDLVFEQLSARQCRVVLISPELTAADITRITSLPRLTVVTQPVPITALTEQADAVITHGGMGLISLALSKAKPLLLLPQTSEQLILSRQMVTRKLAFATTRTTDRAALAERLDSLLQAQSRPTLVDHYASRYKTQSIEIAAHNVIELLASS